ncbi:hypothetical protein HCN44_006600 [Aphidius gifuensis]|uniref:SMB domain-containing protein n=1 Tax=Aphidius gifuensis TaxID=684658 RepID=A0A835CVL5_APHGI|nr:poly(U)-specific endoribonuclease-like [Aphidius gifuensis]KAF7995493.1 hypothetical protein HCN44_006600 [Aphidius gifuensis]
MTISMIPSKSTSCESRSFDGLCCQGDPEKVCKKSKRVCSCDQFCLDGDELRSDCCPDYREWCRPKKNVDPSCSVLSNNGTCCQGKNVRCMLYNVERTKKCYCDDNCTRENDCCKDYQAYCQTPGAQGYFDAENNLEVIYREDSKNKTDKNATNKIEIDEYIIREMDQLDN